MCSDGQRATGRLALAVALAAAVAAAGCGNKKPPRPAPRMVPAQTTDLSVAQRGLELQFALTYPAVTISGLPLTELEAVELWRMTRPLRPPTEDGETAPADAAGEPATVEPPVEPAGEPPTSPFLFRRPTGAGEKIRAEEKIQVEAREFLALAALELRIEGAELSAAISGDRILLRLPLAVPPPETGAEEDREVEIYAIQSVSPKGLASELSNLVKILPRPPPPSPSQLDTRPGNDGVSLVWQAEDPPAGFRIYRRDAASRNYGEPIARPAASARSHLDRTAQFDSRYVYSVTAVALEGPLTESALAAEHEVHYRDRFPPPAPSGLIILTETGRARLLWEPSEADDLAGYLVYRQDDQGAGFERLSAEPGLELGYLDSAVASGRSYSYYVSAVDRSGNESEASGTATAEIP